MPTTVGNEAPEALVAWRGEFVTADAAGGVGLVPLDGPGTGGVGVDVAAEFASQVGNRGEDAASDDVAFDLGEPDFNLVEPASRSDFFYYSFSVIFLFWPREGPSMRLALEQIRKHRGMTQVEMAKILCVNQSGLSKLEQRPDMYVSMLRSYIQALGGRLELRAVFSRERIEIGGLEDNGTLADLRDLVNSCCRIEPIPPDLPYNKFLVISVDENIVTLRKGSNDQYLHVPTRRVAEVLPAKTGDRPVIVLKGSLAWAGQKKLWEFHPA
jgi:DNA-binding XRE family transcriptional regulator